MAADLPVPCRVCGGAPPVLLDALRAREIDLETLTAFAVTADRGRQTAVWEQMKARGYPPTSWEVRRMLTEDRIPATSDLARFVGVGVYEAAGGAVDRDLFAKTDDAGVWLCDPKLLRDLATAKLEAAAEELRTRWRWAEARIETDWGATARFGRVHPRPGEATPEEQAEIERLQTRHDELAARDESDWTDDLVAEAERIEERLDEVHTVVEARAVYRREDLGLAGCIVTVGEGGGMRAIQGLVRPEDMPRQEPGTVNGAGTGPGARRGSPTPRTARPGASTRRRSRDRRRPPTRKPRRARRPASASAWPTTCTPSARASSRPGSPATSTPPSTCSCSSSPTPCSGPATGTTRSK